MGESIDLHVGGYHLTESIGTGGMGSVFRATVESDDKPVARGATVAVKLLHPHLRSVGEFVKRFHREARLAEQINHPNVIRILDDGVDDRKHYIVMELAEGLKLNDLIGGQPLSPQQTIEVMNQICEALKAAAAVEDPDEPGRLRSLVHRDIKPDNIIIEPLDPKQYETMTQTGDKTALANIRVKLLDFGLAKDVKALSTVLSQTGQSLGTPAYMSPEQCRGENVDPRSDLYSLGVVAYHMITGTQPFAGPTTVAYAAQHAEEIPPDILKRNPMCPRSLGDCIYRCLAKDPADRYAAPAELQADLARVAQGQGVSKVHKFRRKGSFSHRKVAAIVAATLVLGVLAVVGGWFLLTDRAKAGLADALQRADGQIAAQDYTGAKRTLEDGIASVPDRPDKADLTAPARMRLQEIAPRAALQEQAHAQAQHAQEALAVIAEIKAKIAAGRYQPAIDAAHAALQDFSDTPSGKELPDLIAAATEKLRSAQEASDARQEAQRLRQVAEAQAVRTRFIRYRDAGIAAMKGKDYETAKIALANAVKEQDDADTQALLDECRDRTTRHRIAVADFKVIGDVGIPQAGQSVAELLLPKFGDRYQVVERAQLEAILKEVDLTIAQIVENPALLKGRKVQGVRYLVIGSVNRLGNLAISARLVDIVKNPGDHVQTAEAQAEDARGLQNALGNLAKVLQMTSEEKKAYLDQDLYPQLLSDARAKVKASEHDAAIALYQRVLAIRGTPEVEGELKAALAQQAALAKAQEEQRLKSELYRKLIYEAQRRADSLPPTRENLSVEQKRIAADGLRYVERAMGCKPEYNFAHSFLQSKFETYLTSPKELTLDLGNNVSMKLALIPAGKFMMGCPKDEKGRCNGEDPQHEVTLRKPFYMGIYEVTQDQYQQVMGKNPSNTKGLDLPVNLVSWDDAMEFCKRLSQKSGQTVRLPTEAQWEYACRANTKTRFCFGDNDEDLIDYGWYHVDVNKFYCPMQAVGKKRPNAFGLYDMHGNVWEWCADWYAEDYYSAAGNSLDPQGPEKGLGRVSRGGGADEPARCSRSASRLWCSPTTPSGNFGFRVLMEPPTPQSAPAAKNDDALTLDLGNNVSMKMAMIPAGKFTMGSRIVVGSNNHVDTRYCEGGEWPRREVTISKPFCMGIYEVTQEQYQQVMGENPSKFVGGQNPVEQVTWDKATEFCRRVSQRTGKTVGLPTEAQWEYACRAGTDTLFCFGDDFGDLSDYAWYQTNSEGHTHGVGQKAPNAFGLRDMHGNVWEWCSDWYDVGYYSVKGNDRDPQGPGSGRVRVLRGGGWNNSARCRSASRHGSSPDATCSVFGFRVVMESPAQTPQSAPAPTPRPAPADKNDKGLTLDLGKNVSMKLAMIPAGKFIMGSPKEENRSAESPQREVTISRPFYMGVYEVTQEQYETVMGQNPSYYVGSQRPVEQVSWEDAAEFCRRLSQKTRRTVRLPTEAQWEYACRAGSTTRYSFGDDRKALGDYDWYDYNMSNRQTHPVGEKKPSKWGLYDMYGNVGELCADWYSPDYYSARENSVDPQGPSSGKIRVVRGGWATDNGANSRSSATRYQASLTNGIKYIGFRVVVESPAQPAK